MSDESAWKRVAREHAMFAEGTGGPCRCATCQAAAESARLAAEVKRLREATTKFLDDIFWDETGDGSAVAIFSTDQINDLRAAIAPEGRSP